MKVDLILVYEDPTFGVRGSRKFWAASFDIAEDQSGSVATRWGRIQPGVNLNIKWLSGQQHKSVPCEDAQCALAFVEKKSREKAEKGYKVLLYEVDGVNIGQLHGTAADENGNFKMQQWGRR